MPGTPCVFLSHWKAHKTIIKKLITARKVVGLNNQSTILNAMAQADGFILNVQGTIGKTLLLLGTTTGIDLAGYKLAVEGENFKYYVSENVDISTINDIQEDTPPFTAPDFCKVNEGETCAFFEILSSAGVGIKPTTTRAVSGRERPVPKWERPRKEKPYGNGLGMKFPSTPSLPMKVSYSATMVTHRRRTLLLSMAVIIV